ncbi:hypothetical protein ASD15_16110 [Massilia sp. Root351]|jgi:hypothetical protein|uniref:DUF2325 domain-containing protein n=1 Tax=Massilia sp. Root351 TaxID=1736522 RepID=UPI00070D106C|nr:DUF2325 domain-containing protein [Massilia sp. Root351]KQV80375.1 hypothetical protein ASD15_16110 [Massilia sp. Root351]
MCDKHQVKAAPAAHTSRRRRLWELGHACHCPLVGVGMPLAALRKLVGKITGGTVVADDYEVHVGVVTECGARNRLSEALQKELERRYAGVLLRFKNAKDTEAVAALWRLAVANGDVAGAFWAGLTHARCTPELEEQMCRDLHMVQHQAGACARADITRFHAVLEENSRMTRELARLQQRNAAMQLERNAELDQHASQLMQLRAQLVGRDSLADSLRHELEQLRASIPGLDTRDRLAQRLSQVDERERALRNQVAELKQELTRAQAALAAQATAASHAAPPVPAGQHGHPAQHPMPHPADAASAGAPAQRAPGLTEHVVRMPERLADRSILCVGGRTGNVATYRALIERVGAQFAHHDGGLEDNANKLEASLAAADLVICQTGCISHSAYWRVKDFCKRTGKRCVFIDNPSISSLARGLEEADLA